MFELNEWLERILFCIQSSTSENSKKEFTLYIILSKVGNLIFWKCLHNPLVPLSNYRERYSTEGVCVKIIQRTKKLN